jgi:HlyD family secretion protein
MKTLSTLLVLSTLLCACKPGSGQSIRFSTANVVRGDLRAYVTATGTLSAVVSVDVGSQVSGLIVALNADYNSPVKKGDLVAEIDDSIYEAKVKEAEGELDSARAMVKLKQQSLARKQSLVPIRAATQLDLDQAVAELAQAEASVKIKAAMLDRARVDLGYCRIVAPVDGLVVSRKVDLGQTVAAAMTTPVLYTIAQDIKQMNIVASVSEADVGNVKMGQMVEFSVDAFPDDVFEGKVSQVRMAPKTKENVVTYETIIAVDNREQKLFPGMTADVTILVSERTRVLKMPNTALRFTPPDGVSLLAGEAKKLRRREQLAYVLSPDGKQLQPIVVTTGITDSTDTEILAGADEQTRVVTSATGLAKGSGFPPNDGPPPAL